MRKFLLLVCLGMAFAAFGASNLLPPPEKWELSFDARAVVTGKIEKQNGKSVFHINMTSPEGYAYYCCRVPVSPGEYTFRAHCRGNTAKGILRSAYAFDAQGNAKCICFSHGVEGVQNPEVLQDYLTVPAGYVSVRFDLGVSCGGECFIDSPELLSGKQPAPAPAAELTPIHKGWMADWIFLQNDPGEPSMRFTKEVNLKDGAAFAVVQLTADNGYELRINGQLVGGDMDWATVEKYDVAKFLKAGHNVIQVDLFNFDGAGGLLLQGEITTNGGDKVPLLSDESWKLTLPNGKAGTLEKLGKVPVMPWGKVAFHQTMPPEILKLKIAQAVTDITAGEMLQFAFVPNAALLDAEDLTLKLTFFDAAGRVTPLSGMEPFVRLVPENKTLWVELPTSRFAMPGRYRAELAGEGFVIPCPEVNLRAGGKPDKAGKPLPAPSENNFVSQGGKQLPLTVYCTSTPTDEHARNWSRVGAHYYEFNLSSGEWRSDMRYDTAGLEKYLLSVLEYDPEASLILKFTINAPGWWAVAHRDQLTVTNNKRQSLQSFCSELWRKDAFTAMCNTLDYLEHRPVGKAIIGILPMGFEGGEFQLWGQSANEYDCSIPTQDAFNQYLTAHHIQRAVTLPNPALNAPFRAEQPGDAEVRDDFFRFLAERHADNMIWFAKEFKKRYKTRYAYGVYFGYGLEYAGATPRMLMSGHLGLEKIFREAQIDYISCPLSYGLRPLDKSHAFMFPVESARMHGVLPIGENDVRNCFTPEFADGSGVSIHSMTKSILDNKRIRLFEAMHGALVRYYAIHSIVDWYNHPAMVRTIQADDALVRTLRANPVGGAEQVVLVANYLEWTRGWRVPDKTFLTFAGNARDTLMRTGRPVAFVTMEDYLAALDKWQNAVIPLPGLLTQAQTSALEAKFGKLPAIALTDGALLLQNGQWKVLNADAAPETLWQEFATAEAKAAGFNTVWYVGSNFKFKYDGKSLVRVK